LKVLCKREFKKLCYNVLRLAYQDHLKMICFTVVDQVLFGNFSLRYEESTIKVCKSMILGMAL